MNQNIELKEYTLGISRPKIFQRWWLRTRPTRLGLQLGPEGIPPCIEVYIPWWSWPLELLHRFIFGYSRLKK